MTFLKCNVIVYIRKGGDIMAMIEMNALSTVLCGSFSAKVFFPEMDKLGLGENDYDKKYPDQLNNFLALPTKEESERINELQANLDTASQELATKLTLGQIPLSDLEKEVEKLDELGLSELLEIAQARYDRYLANLPS